MVRKIMLNTSSSLINGYYQNVRGLRTNLHILRCNIPLHNVDYFILMETCRLDINISDSELGLVKCNVFRADQSGNTSNTTRGGNMCA